MSAMRAHTVAAMRAAEAHITVRVRTTPAIAARRFGVQTAAVNVWAAT